MQTALHLVFWYLIPGSHAVMFVYTKVHSGIHTRQSVLMSIINGATLNASKKTKEVKTLKQEILSQSSGVKYVEVGFFTEVFAV